MDIEMTKSAEKSLNLLYSKYKKRCKKETKDSAASFQEPYQSEIYRAVKPYIPELKQKGLVTARLRQVQLTPEGIAFMESKKRKKIKCFGKAVKKFFSSLFKFVA